MILSGDILTLETRILKRGCILVPLKKFYAPLAQLVEALVLGTKGSPFESEEGHQYEERYLGNARPKENMRRFARCIKYPLLYL